MGRREREQASADLRHALDALGELKPDATWDASERQRWYGVDEALRKVIRKRDPQARFAPALAAYRMAWNWVGDIGKAHRRTMGMAEQVAIMRKLAPVILDILLGEEE